MADGGDTLESLLNKATNPLNRQEEWELIIAFCDQVNKELEGPQIAVRLLSHKIQSPQEREALYSLSVLEACVKNCGRRFHQEIGKFRFLNEMIKVVSPKYLGTHTSEKVKKRCIELLYSWSEGLQHEAKIRDAYHMLKQQGIVKEDPKYIDQTFDPPPPGVQNTLFQDEEKSKLLARLLKSKHPEDLQAANRLIKNMVKQDQERMEKATHRVQQLETVSNNIKVLSEMLALYNPTVTSEAEKDVMKELYENLEKQRPSLFCLASDASDAGSRDLVDILQVNDDVMRIMTSYKQIVMGEQNGVLIDTETDNHKMNSSSLLDLDIDTQLQRSASGSEARPTLMSGSSVLDDQLAALGLIDDPVTGSEGDGNSVSASAKADCKSDLQELGDIFNATDTKNTSTNVGSQSLLDNLSVINPVRSSGSIGIIEHNTSSTKTLLGAGDQQLLPSSTLCPQPSAPLTLPRPLIGHPQQKVAGILDTSASQPMAATYLKTGILPQTGVSQRTVDSHKQQIKSKALDDLDELGQTILKQTLANDKKTKETSVSSAASDSKADRTALVSPITTPSNSTTASPQRVPSTTNHSGTSKPTSSELVPLTDIFVTLESIKPGNLDPLTIYEKGGVKLVVHFGRDRPRPDVQVMVISAMSTNPKPVKNFVFQAAVPKIMKVKLQPPSATNLPEYNPILPPAAITQILLVANPQKEIIRLKFKVSYVMDSNSVTEVGEADNFPVR